MKPRVLAVHALDPQPRLLAQSVQSLLAGGVVAVPTDACYALVCRMGDSAAVAKMRSFRKLDERHLLSLLCRNLADIGACGMLDNAHFRLVKAAIPGPYTFILTAQRALSRNLTDMRRKTIGVRVPAHPVTRGLIEVLDELLVCTSLIAPGEELPMVEPGDMARRLNGVVDIVLDGGLGSDKMTTVIDLSTGEARLVRQGLGSTTELGLAL